MPDGMLPFFWTLIEKWGCYGGKMLKRCGMGALLIILKDKVFILLISYPLNLI